MYIAQTTVPARSAKEIPLVVETVRQAFETAGVGLEHLTVLAEPDQLTVTLYIQAANQNDADAMARLAGVRLSTMLPVEPR